MCEQCDGRVQVVGAGGVQMNVDARRRGIAELMNQATVAVVDGGVRAEVTAGRVAAEPLYH